MSRQLVSAQRSQTATAARDACGAVSVPQEAGNSKTGKSGAHIGWRDRPAIFDRPDSVPPVAATAFGRPSRVVQRIRVHDYLVWGMEVFHQNTVVVESEFTSPSATPAPKNITGPGAAAASVRAEHHAALLRRFPDWTFYRRAKEARSP